MAVLSSFVVLCLLSLGLEHALHLGHVQRVLGWIFCRWPDHLWDQHFGHKSGRCVSHGNIQWLDWQQGNAEIQLSSIKSIIKLWKISAVSWFLFLETSGIR